MEYLGKNLQRFRNTGFTIVEVLIVVTVIVVLVGLSGFAATSYVKTSRDSSRESKATIIANALEKYYDQNGEYPSVALMTNTDTNMVRQKLSITDKDVFKFPLASSSATNSVTNGSASTTQLKYTANTEDQTTPGVATQCQSSTTGYCDFFTLSYVKEADGQTVTIKSQNSSTVVNVKPATPSKPVVSASFISNSLIRLSTTSVTCGSSEIAEYKIRYNNASASESSMPAWSDLSWSSSTTRDINPGSQVNFYLQSIAHCVNEFSVASDDSPASDIVTYVKPTPPPAPTVTASAVPTSSKSVTLTFSAPTATSYTVSGPGTAASCKTSPCTVTGLGGNYYYTFSVTASNIAGTSPATTAGVTTTPFPTTPSPVTTASVYYSTATDTIWAWQPTVCNVGSPEYRFRVYLPGYEVYATGYGSTTATSTTLDSSTQGYIYRLHIEARCINGTESSTYSAVWASVNDMPRAVLGSSWIYDGWSNIVHNGGNAMWAQSRVTGIMQNCPAGAPQALRYGKQINQSDNYSFLDHVPEWNGSTYNGYHRSNLPEGTMIEFKWASGCFNFTTGLHGPDGWNGSGWNRADIFGNPRVVTDRTANNPGQWRRGCDGGFYDIPPYNWNRDVACTDVAPRAPAQVN